MKVTAYENGEGIMFQGEWDELADVFEQFAVVGKTGKTSVYKSADMGHFIAKAKGPYRYIDFRKDTSEEAEKSGQISYEVHLQKVGPAEDADKSVTSDPVKMARKFFGLKLYKVGN